MGAGRQEIEEFSEEFVSGRTQNGKPLKPYELGIVCKHLRAQGMRLAEIAKRLEVSRQYVDDLLLLHAAPEAIRNMVVEDRLSAGTAIRGLRRYGKNAEVALERAIERARCTGSARVGLRHFDATIRNKALRRKAPLMFEVLQQVCGDPGFRSLAAPVQATLRRTLLDLQAYSDDARARISP